MQAFQYTSAAKEWVFTLRVETTQTAVLITDFAALRTGRVALVTFGESAPLLT